LYERWNKMPKSIGTILFGEGGDVIRDARIQALVLASGVLIMESAVLSPIIADLAIQFSVGEARAGLLMLAYTIPLVILVPIMGILSDRYGRKYFLVPGLALFGLAGVGIAFVSSFDGILILRMLQSVGHAASGPIVIAMIGDFYSGVQETTAQGIRTAGINMGIIGIPILSGILFVFSWRYPFLLYFIAIPVAIWAWYVIPQTKETSGSSIGDYINELLALFKKPRMAYLVSTFVVRFLLLFGFLTYISVLAIGEAGLSVKAAGLLVAVKGVTSLLSSTQVGRLSNRFSTENIIIGGFSIGSAGVILMGIVPTSVAIAIGAVLYGFGDGIVSPSQKSLVNQISPDGMRGGAVSVATTLQNLGKVVGPGMIAVMLLVSNISIAFTIVGMTGLIGGVGLMIGFKRSKMNFS
jgi:ACDE family multidrug resistance protein